MAHARATKTERTYLVAKAERAYLVEIWSEAEQAWVTVYSGKVRLYAKDEQKRHEDKGYDTRWTTKHGICGVCGSERLSYNTCAERR